MKRCWIIEADGTEENLNYLDRALNKCVEGYEEDTGDFIGIADEPRHILNVEFKD